MREICRRRQADANSLGNMLPFRDGGDATTKRASDNTTSSTSFPRSAWERPL